MRPRETLITMALAVGALVVLFLLCWAIVTVGLFYCIGALAFLALFVWCVLAPWNIFFTFVKEGEAKIVIRGDAVQKILIQWRGYILDGYGNVVPVRAGDREPWHIGGFRFVGWWPMDRVYTYKFRWTGVHEDGIPQAHEEVLDSVLVKDFVYFAELKDAEDQAMVPLTVGLLITMRVVNPYEALFRVGDWLELVLNRIKPLFREYVARHTYAQLISEKQAVGGEVWEQLSLTGLIEEFERDYGVRIKVGGIEMKDITPHEEYQKAATQRYLAERTAERRAMETVGTIVRAMAESRGKTAEEMKTLIDGDPELQREFLDAAKDLLTRTMAIEGRSFVDIRVGGGAQGMEASLLLNLLAAWKRMPTGRGEGGEPQGEPPAEAEVPKTEALSQEASVRHNEVWRRIKEKKGKE